jgi:glucose-1-phosphate cytidylyltransferase
MKVIILAGGLGTRISEETEEKPKPMVLIDDKPILWHVMNIYAMQGYADFIIATGYKHQVIEEYVKQLKTDLNIQCVFTGDNSQTAKRISLCLNELDSKEDVFVTYGDGLGNVNLTELKKYHEKHEKLATVTAVRPPARFGVMEFKNGLVSHFGEKSQADSGWINGGFFLLKPEIIRFITGQNDSFEIDVLPRLVAKNELMAYEHTGFWQPMDTLREKNILASLSQQTIPPWMNSIMFDGREPKC